MKKVLHYKTNFLNSSETFIDRLVSNHKCFKAAALCYRKKEFTDEIPVFAVPTCSFSSFINIAAFHLNLPLPYYYSAIEEYKPDIIHSHFGFDGVKLMRIAKKMDIPHVISFYGSDVSRLPRELGWKNRYLKLSEKGSHFIAATKFMKQQLIKLGFPEDKISIVRFGVDLTDPPFIEEFRLTPKLMMVGRMVEKKGFEYAIKAIKNLREKGILTELNLYGSGPLLSHLKSLTYELSLNGTVKFHGYQPIDKILDAHQYHSILMAPSVTAKDGDMEGLPNTILEAMAKGTLVIASRHAAIPEVIEDKYSGFLVNERDEEALTDMLADILNNKYDLNAIRNNARQLIKNEYTIDRMVHEIETIYNNKLENKDA